MTNETKLDPLKCAWLGFEEPCPDDSIKARFDGRFFLPVCSKHMFGAKPNELKSFSELGAFAGPSKVGAKNELAGVAEGMAEMLPLLQPVLDIISGNKNADIENENWWKVFLMTYEKLRGSSKMRTKKAAEAADLAVIAWKTRAKATTNVDPARKRSSK